MSWVRIDDQMPDHPKMLGLGIEGLGLQVAALCYCNRQLTDGLIPLAAMPRLTGMGQKASLIWGRRMVEAGLWEEHPGGFQVHDYLEYQPSRATTLQKRAKDLARKRGGFRVESAGIPSLPIPIPTQPNPIPPPQPPPDEGDSRESVVVVSKLYENEIGTISLIARNKIIDLADTYELSCIEGAFDIAVKANKRRLDFVEGICRNHKAQGSCIDARQTEQRGAGLAAVAGPSAYPRGYEPAATILD